MSLVQHAEAELRRAGLFSSDSDYGGMIGEAVLELVRKFAEQGHSGASAMQTLVIFDQVARFKPLTPITSDPSEWTDVSEMSGRPMWQSTRKPSTFSTDGGKTWYDLDEPKDGAS